MSVREVIQGAFAVAWAVLGMAGCQTPQREAPPSTPEDRFSYALGSRLGTDLRGSGHQLDRELVLRGVEDGLDGSSLLSEEETAAALEEGMQRKLEREDAHRAEIALAAERAGAEFLAQNRTRPGVVELPSGLQYEVLREGSGPAPGLEDFVTCHYRGTLLDGTVFDDTGERGSPRTFRVTSVIDGVEEALLRMQAGARWKLYVPAALGYGARGAGPKIPPNSTLVFEVELLEVRAAATNQAR